MTTFLRAALLCASACAGLTLAASPAQAVGCLSGATAGAIAGHMAGGHAVVGAAGGCFIGHELAVKKKREAEANKLISDYEAQPDGSPQRSKDVAGISRLARKDVPVAVKWMQEHGVNRQ
jgi:phage tail tape-measure protein